MKEVKISDVKFSAASPAEIETGHLGYVSVVLNGALRLDGLAVRRTADGRFTLSFPARRDASGQQHYYLRPLDDAARRDIEFQVFRALGLKEAMTR